MKTLVSIFLVGLFLGNGSPLRGQDKKIRLQASIPPPGFFDETYQFLFFAVLEGCYTDGLTDEDIDFILPKDSLENFVLSCPICESAYEGFTLYSNRHDLIKRRSKAFPFDTFGRGLSDEIRTQLAKPGQDRRDAIQELIGKWVNQRIAKLRLTDEETKTLREELAEMRKEGEKALKRFQSGKSGDGVFDRYKDWHQGCAVCSGAASMGGE